MAVQDFKLFLKGGSTWSKCVHNTMVLCKPEEPHSFHLTSSDNYCAPYPAAFYNSPVASIRVELILWGEDVADQCAVGLDVVAIVHTD